MALTDKIIWQIEMKVHEALNLTDLANLCAVTPYHMIRAFRIATGYSPMAYLRERRLSLAAQELADGNRDILSVALDAQYGSHEAFTRAFASYFQCLPSTIRKKRSISGLALMEPLQMKTALIIDLEPPVVEHISAMTIAGISSRFSYDNTSEIPSLWRRFNMQCEAPLLGDRAFGVCYDGDDAGHFRYMAGAVLKAGEQPPQGMDTVSVPAGRYAMFTYSGHVSGLPKVTYTIWNKSLPDSGLEPRSAPELEVYGRSFDLEIGRGEIGIWIPVV